jgi:hypothetical protein
MRAASCSLVGVRCRILSSGARRLLELEPVLLRVVVLADRREPMEGEREGAAGGSGARVFFPDRGRWFIPATSSSISLAPIASLNRGFAVVSTISVASFDASSSCSIFSLVRLS